MFISKSWTNRFVANLKIIVTLREPVARELSWYNHQIKQKKIQNISFEETSLDLCHQPRTTGTMRIFLPSGSDYFPEKIYWCSRMTRSRQTRQKCYGESEHFWAFLQPLPIRILCGNSTHKIRLRKSCFPHAMSRRPLQTFSSRRTRSSTI